MSCFSGFGQMNLDILFDGFQKLPGIGEEVFAEGFDIQLGGGPILYPIILNRFGINTKLGTFLSEDIQSEIAVKLLEKLNFKNHYNFYHHKEGHPVVVTSVLSCLKDRSFVSYNEQIREDSLNEDDVYHFLKGSKITFAPHGSLDVLKKLKADHTSIVFDIGWQDDLHIDIYKETLKYVDVFTPNDKEAMKMTNTDSIEEALKVLSSYVKHPIISIGDKGCVTYMDDQTLHVPMPTKFEAIDTTGAGDNFLTGIIYGLYMDWPIIECMKMGNVLGGYSTTALGCYKADITLEEALKYLRKYKE